MTAASPDDAVLVDKLRDSRDLDAFSVLYDRHCCQAYGVARRIVGDPAVAEDVLQDVFAKVWEHPEKYDARRGPFRRWLLYAVHNKAIDVLRHSATRATDPLRTDQHPVVPGAGDVVVDSLENQRVRDEVRAACSRLPADQREALHLAYWDGCSQREIAALTHAPVGTVKWRIHAAVKRLGTDLRTTEGRSLRYG